MPGTYVLRLGLLLERAGALSTSAQKKHVIHSSSLVCLWLGCATCLLVLVQHTTVLFCTAVQFVEVDKWKENKNILLSQSLHSAREKSNLGFEGSLCLL